MSYGKNRWKGFVVGMLGSIAGLLAMRYYWNNIAPKITEQFGNQGGGEEQQDAGSHGSDSISVIGTHHKPDESATEALGRITYSWLNGGEPSSEETTTTLSNLVHWGYGLFQGANYGAMRADAGFPDLRGGLMWGTGLWLFGDELAVPMLGLQDGPGAVSQAQHLNRFGAHLAYGVALAATTQALRRIL